MGYTGRRANVAATAAHDPKRSFVGGTASSNRCRSTGTSNSRSGKCGGEDREMTDRNRSCTNDIQFRLSDSSRHPPQLIVEQRLKRPRQQQHAWRACALVVSL